MPKEHVWQKQGPEAGSGQAVGTEGRVQVHMLLHGQSSRPAETLRLLEASQST